MKMKMFKYLETIIQAIKTVAGKFLTFFIVKILKDSGREVSDFLYSKDSCNEWLPRKLWLKTLKNACEGVHF